MEVDDVLRSYDRRGEDRLVGAGRRPAVQVIDVGRAVTRKYPSAFFATGRHAALQAQVIGDFDPSIDAPQRADIGACCCDVVAQQDARAYLTALPA